MFYERIETKITKIEKKNKKEKKKNTKKKTQKKVPLLLFFYMFH